MTSQRLTLPFSFSGTDQRDLADLFAEYGCTTRWLGASELDLTGPTWLVEEIIEDFVVAKQVVVAHLSARSVAEA